MADAPSGSGSALPPTKAIGSLAKKQSDVTRQGTQKLKFVPTLPARRKKEEVKPEPTPQALPSASTLERGRGRGRGRGEGRGRGRGRGAPRPELEMTASGPFAMGPALAGNNARRAVPRSNFAPVPIPGAGAALGSSLVRGAAPSLKREGDLKGKGVVAKVKEDEEVYSDPDEGVEIVDMEDVRQMDWMAPESLRKEKRQKGKKELSEAVASDEQINRANALDLSESEEEEELEDIIEHFAARADIDQDATLREERLYFFQFPSPFPTFTSTVAATGDDPEISDAIPPEEIKPEPGTSKGVPSANAQIPEPKVDGVIGRLEVYRSGAVKMRLANGILLDVNAATQPSFLQQAVYLDKKENRLSILGEVNKRFSVSPDIDTLLASMEEADKAPNNVLDGEGLIQMDTA